MQVEFVGRELGRRAFIVIFLGRRYAVIEDAITGYWEISNKRGHYLDPYADLGWDMCQACREHFAQLEGGGGMSPRRIQRQRTKGWRMPAGAVYVGRPTKWGNLWTVGLEPCGCRAVGECHHNAFRAATAREAVDEYRWWLETAHLPKRLAEKLAPLRGRDLACWCPLDQPCHADVLLELANASEGVEG